MPALTVDIEGLPVAQGSLVANGYGRGLRHSNDKALKSMARIDGQATEKQSVSWTLRTVKSKQP